MRVELENSLGKSTMATEKWFRDMGFQEGRLGCYRAEDETNENLRNCFIKAGDVDPEELIRTYNKWLYILGDSGCGKTTLAKMIKSRCYPNGAHTRTISLHIFLETWLKNPNVRSSDFIDAYQTLILAFLSQQIIVETFKLLEEDLNFLPNINLSDERSSVYSNLKKVSEMSILETDQQLTENKIRVWLSDLLLFIRGLGFERIICLVDYTSSLTATDDYDQQDLKVLKLLKIFLHSIFRRDVSHLIFFYLLPQTLKAALLKDAPTFRLHKSKVYELNWDNRSLKEALRQRVKVFSRNRFQSLAELCVPEDGFNNEIENKIAYLSEGTPRTMLRLVELFVREHCLRCDNSTSDLFNLKDWENTCQKWCSDIRQFAFPSKHGFYSDGSNIFYKGLVQDQGFILNLSKQANALLLELVCARDYYCSNESLQKIMGNITDIQLRKAVSRLKKALIDYEIFEYEIKALRKQGYYIQYVEYNAQIIQKTQSRSIEASQREMREIYKFIKKSFNDDDLTIICFEMGIDYDELKGDILSRKILSLIQFCDKRGRVIELKKNICDARPEIPWEDELQRGKSHE